MTAQSILSGLGIAMVTVSGLWALGGCWIGFWRWYRGDDLFDDRGL